MPQHNRVRDLSILAFAMTFPTVMGWLYFIVLPARADETSGVLPTVFGLAKVVQFAFPLIAAVVFYRDMLVPSRPTARGLGVGLAFGIATGAAVIGLNFAVKSANLFAGMDHKIFDWLTKLHCNTTVRYAVLAGFYAIVHSLLEEYYWRWFVFGRLRLLVPWSWAAVISGLAFMSHHVILLMHYVPDQPGYFWLAVVPLSLGVGVGGMIWAWLYQWSESLYAPWASHGLVDLAIMVVGYDLLKSLL